jgi:hypothetical protein
MTIAASGFTAVFMGSGFRRNAGFPEGLADSVQARIGSGASTDEREVEAYIAEGAVGTNVSGSASPPTSARTRRTS